MGSPNLNLMVLPVNNSTTKRSVLNIRHLVYLRAVHEPFSGIIKLFLEGFCKGFRYILQVREYDEVVSEKIYKQLNNLS